MPLFKRKVQETVTDAVGVVKDIAAKATAERMDVWGDVAKIGLRHILQLSGELQMCGAAVPVLDKRRTGIKGFLRRGVLSGAHDVEVIPGRNGALKLGPMVRMAVLDGKGGMLPGIGMVDHADLVAVLPRKGEFVAGRGKAGL